MEVPQGLRLETLIAAQESRMDPDDDPLGTLAPITCPDRHGARREVREGALLRYRCHTGHAFSAESLQEAQGEEWGRRALYRGLRVQEGQLVVVRRMAEDARGAHAAPASLRDLEERAQSYQEGAGIVRRLLESGRRARGDGG